MFRHQGEPVDDVQHLVLGWVVASPSHCTLRVLIGCNAIAMHCYALQLHSVSINSPSILFLSKLKYDFQLTLCLFSAQPTWRQ